MQKIRLVLSKLTVYLIKCLNHFNGKWLATEYIKDDSFADLTPNDNADPKKLYEGAIQWALKNKDVKNIALSGPYGSGKSSILKTFQKEHAEYEYLNISLASFKEYSEEDSPKIEFSILHQIFYHVKHQQIPYSRFKRIKSVSKVKLLFRSAGLICWILALLFLIKKDLLPLLPEWKDFVDANEAGIKFICIATVLSGSIYMLYLAFKIYNNSKFNKLNLTSGELEIVPEVDSILSEHLDEIIYFFEATRYNVVIIEDLDRFKNPEIFTKLREMNSLVNNSKQIARKISFIYALRDDVFVDETRTKFFDFIIPVIPVTNSANSGELLMARIEKMGLSSIISSEFISTISYYISDMRLLINILNEFQLYKGHLEDSNLNVTNLLGIIIYKNKYPTDFSRLHNNEGMIFKLFDDKQVYINNLTAELVQRRDLLVTLIEQSKSNFIKSIDELKAIYLEVLYEHLNSFTGSIHLKDQKYTLQQLRDEHLFAALRTQTNIIYTHTGGDKRSAGFGFKFIEDKIDAAQSYAERETAIKTLNEYRLSTLEEELESVKEKISLCRSYSIQDIIKERDIEYLTSDLSNEKLLVYLISNGYLNEEYYYYMSYFYEGRITQKDFEFILSIKDKKALPFEFKLTKIAEVIKKLRLKEFAEVETLNIDLLNFQLANKTIYEDELNVCFGQLKELTPINVSFIETYISLGAHVDIFMQLLCRACNKLWVFIEIESNYPAEKRDRYLHLILSNGEINALKEMNLQDMLREYIANMKDFISFAYQIPVTRLCELLPALGVKFKQLNPPSKNNVLFDCIYREDIYQLNPYMINTIIDAKGTPSEYAAGTYSSVLLSGCELLINYVRKNILVYLEDGFLHLPDDAAEMDEAMKEILNTSGINSIGAERIIKKVHFKISEIRSIVNADIKKLLLKHSRMEAGWKNVSDYYYPTDHRYSFNSPPELFIFLNTRENYMKLGAADAIDLDRTRIYASALLGNLIVTGGLSVSAIRELVKPFGAGLAVNSIYGLPEEQVKVLVKSGSLKYTKDIVGDLVNKYPQLLLTFIETNLGAFFEKLDELELTDKVYEEVLLSSKLSGEQRERLKTKYKGSSV